MLLLDLPGTDPCFNLAVEEFLLKERKEDFLVIYSNSPCVIIGKHQVAHRESDTEFITKNNIPVIRRISGGGAVYHDDGNINFSFITQSSAGRQVDFKKYTGPVTEFLATLGVDARLEGKNDLKVDSLKISGNAEHVFRERVLHHGTLLFSANLGNLRGSLRKDRSAYVTKGVDSNPSQVVNLSELLPEEMNIGMFRMKLIRFFSSQPGNQIFSLTPVETEKIKELAEKKYRKWEWNYAYGPAYEFSGIIQTGSGRSSVSLQVNEGLITGCTFSDSSDPDLTEKKFIGKKHMPQIIRAIFAESKGFSEAGTFNFF